MNNSNNNNFTILYQETHYEVNRPKLQWLIVLIPVVGAFVLYTVLRVKHNRRKRREFLESQLLNALTHRIVTTGSSTTYLNHHMTTTTTTTISYSSSPAQEVPQQPSPPPPAYSVCSPPKYNDIIIEHQERASFHQ